MKHFLALALTASTFIAAPASAAAIVGLYNTGVDDSGNKLADGSVDTHYSTSGRMPGSPFVYSNSNYVTVADAKFISIQRDGGSVIPVNTFALNFFLTDISNAQLSGFFAADNAATVFLNGIAGATTNTFQGLTAFSFSTGFSMGLNTLNFTVTDFAPPTALLVSGINGSSGAVAGAVPEPATWAMMFMGFGMIGFGLRRRKSNIRTTVSYA